MQHYIHCHQPYDMNKGGSVGYVSSLILSMQNNNNYISKKGVKHSFIIPNMHEAPNYFCKELLSNDTFHEIETYKSYNTNGFIKNKNAWFNSIIPLQEIIKISLKEVKSIQIHGGYNFLPIYNSLKLLGLEKKVVKILTTHNPYKSEIEDMELVTRNRKWKDTELQDFRYIFDRRDYYSYSLADALVFPTEYSMEGYYNTWPEFRKIIKNKKVYFCLTGTEKKEVSLNKTHMRQSLNIPENDIVFLFLGRFIKIRGYDILIEGAKKIFEQNHNIHFVVAGEQRQNPALEHENWHEIPFVTNPGDYINMADACITANRGSYFDLSMIEILSIGTPLISSSVGGYKWLKDKTDGVLFFEKEDVNGFIEQINKFISLNSKIKDDMKKHNQALYDTKLDIKFFGENYLDTIDQLYEDFNISSDINTGYTPLKIKSSPNARLVLDEEYTLWLEGNEKNKEIVKPTHPKCNKQPLIQSKSLTPINTSAQIHTLHSHPIGSKKAKLRKLKNNPNLFFKDMFKNFLRKFRGIL